MKTTARDGARRRLRDQCSWRAVAFALAASAAPGAAFAQAPPSAPDEAVEELVVTGYRRALQSAIATKREATVMVDAINAEDIADFPDANLAESLQRLPGVSIDRENGEGRTITVRGLGSDFTRVRMNGLEALSTAGAADSGSSPNRGRGFDFNTFASELFNSLRVQKTASAETDEGSLGATVDLITGKPFDFKGRRLALSVQDAWYENGGTHNPRVAGLVSDRWDTGLGQFGALVSLAYNSRKQEIDSYLRQAGQSDFHYRGATNAQARDIRGFATPQTPGLRDPGRINTAARGLLNDLTLIPALPNLVHQELEQERLGVTAAFQWRPTDRTTVTVDLVGSRFEQESVLNVLVPVGLNRNNTNTALGQANPSNATRIGAYPGTCTGRAGTEFQDPINCTGTLGTAGALVPGTIGSFNPRNLNAYDYYNSPASPGFINDNVPLSGRYEIVGRPTVIVRDAEVNAANQAVYLALDDVDMAARADEGTFTTDFRQASLGLDHSFSDQFQVRLMYGRSSSRNEGRGRLAEFNRMDSDGFVYDERGDGPMPVMNFGFDVANTANWDFVKAFSAIRHFRRFVDNDFETIRADFNYEHNEAFTFKFGAARRDYEFATGQFQRLTSDVNNPSFLEAGTTVQDMGKFIPYGQGLDTPAGTPNGWWGPDLGKFSKLYGFDCDCVNEFGDWRLSRLSNPGNQFSVKEKDTSYYGQVDFDLEFLGRGLRGNAGVRYAITELDSFGFSPAARPLKASNDYTDVLPSLNLAYEVVDNMYVRFGAAKVMARPLLGNLSPGVSGFSTSLPTSGTPSITVGNPQLKPFRATNLDLSFEWYFAPGGLFAVAVFHKDIASFPQNLTREAQLQDILDEASIQALLSQLSTSAAGQQYAAYILGGGDFTVRQFLDAPGGKISGVEVSYQQDLTFLPDLAARIGWNAPWLANFGVQANYTHLETELTYILNPDNPTGAGVGKGPWTGASPDAFNGTVYYETDRWSARLSAAWRTEYVTQYPLASGTCAPGQCDSPFVNDFGGSDSTFNLDAALTYKLNKFVTLNAEFLNITDQTENRWTYTPHLVGRYASTGRQVFVGARFKF